MGDETRTDDEQTSVPLAGRSILPAPLARGERVGPYRIDAVCGSGGFGTVYRATTGDGRVVALKVLHHYLSDDVRTAARFRREASAGARVEHPGVVRVLELGIEERRMYIAMDWVDGQTVKQQLTAGGPLSLAEVRAVVDPLCEALAAVHAAGVVHRDVKSSNVMLTPEGGDLRVTLLDFGVAKLFARETGAPLSFTSTAATVGSPHAMAPEQFRGGTIDARTDVYALGVLIYEMLTGMRPFAADNAADLRALHLESPPPALVGQVPVPPAVDLVVQRCMAKDPADRFQTVAEAARALADAETQPGATSRSVPAIAAYVSAEPASDDEAGGDAADDLLDAAVAIFDELGLEIVTELPTAVVALAESPANRPAAVELRRQLLDRLLALPATDDVHASIAVHLGRASREEGDTGTVWRGRLLDLSDWAGDAALGVTATPEFLAGLEDDFELADTQVVRAARRR